MAIEIVDFPSYKMVIFHSKLLVHQRVPTWLYMIFTGILSKKIMVKVADFLGFDPENMVIYWDLTKKHGDSNGDSNGDFMRWS